MADVARPLFEQILQFALVQRWVKIACNWELANGLLQLKT
jgi:hypothetical protein